MNPELRGALLAMRLHSEPCEHGTESWAVRDTDGMWACNMACPGGAAVAVVCETCGGSGGADPTGQHDSTAAFQAAVDRGGGPVTLRPCPDCVDGIRILTPDLFRKVAWLLEGGEDQ